MATPLRYQTAGESHGNSLVALIDGLPEGLRIDLEFINHELHRRQGGYGRGARQRIESDTVEVLAGTRAGITIGSPLCLRIVNRDHRLDDAAKTPALSRPRPGHADLAGSLKYGTTDCRGTLERASARETAARVAAGAVARLFLQAWGVETFGFVRGAMDVVSSVSPSVSNWTALKTARDASEVACPDPEASQRIIDIIHRAKTERDTVGGWCETHVFGCVPGVGTCMHWDERLDARLAYAVMGIQAFKAVEIGLGRACGSRFGSKVHDAIVYDAQARESSHFGFERTSNNAGGLEGGMTNGMPIVVQGTMKPISTLLQGMPSVDLITHEAVQSQYERSDVSAIAAASVVMEHVVAFEVARAFLLKFGGDTMREVEGAYSRYRASV